MDKTLLKELTLGTFLSFLCLSNGVTLDFCNANRKIETGQSFEFITDNYSQMTSQFMCTCRLTIPLSNSLDGPSTPIAGGLHLAVEDPNDHPCHQRMVISSSEYLAINFCPSNEHKIFDKNMWNLEAGKAIYIHTIGTPTKKWMIKFQFDAPAAQLVVNCSESNPTNSEIENCPCQGDTGGGMVPHGASSADDLGRRLGIGFGVVIGFLVLVGIIFLVYILLKRRKQKRESEETERKPEQAPPLESKPQPELHDPRVGPQYRIYDEPGQPSLNTNMAYTPDEPQAYTRSSDSGLHDMQNDQPPSYNNHYPNQPYDPAPVADPSVLYARPNKPDTNRRSLAGMGAITGSTDGLYPYADNEVFMTDTSNSHNASKDFTQTEV